MTDYALPLGWVGCTLGDLVTQKTKKASPGDDGCPTVYLGMDDVESESGRILTTQSSSSVKSAGNLAAPGDILYGRLRPYLNKVAVAPEYMLCSGELLVFRAEELVDPRYVEWLLRSPALVTHAMDNSRGDRPRAYWDQLAAFPMSLAPAKEQARIADEIERRLSHLEVAERGLRGALQKLETARSAVIREALEECLVANAADAKSVTTTLGAAFDVSVGSTPSRSNPDLWGGSIPWVSSGEVAWRRIRSTRETVTPQAKMRPHPAGTVLLGMIGEGKTRGQAAIIDIEAAHNQNCASIRVSATEHSPEWVYYQLLYRYDETRRGGSGNNQQALNKALVKALPVVLPAPDVQRRLVAEIDRRLSLLDSARNTITRQLSRCSSARSSILTAAFTGQLVPQDPSDEPATLLLQRIKEQRAASAPTKKTTRRTRAKKETT